ncbi:MAG TPA: hypothetical protein VF759_10115 [Allosphingosinicella sp.]|jgi:hypothetical protein
MPVFQITAPNGRVYRVNAPEGATEAHAIAHLRRQLAVPPKPKPAPPKPRTWGDTISDFRSGARHTAGSFIDGLTGSWSDEIVGAGGPLRNAVQAALGNEKLDPSGAYHRRRNTYVKEHEQFRRQHAGVHRTATGAGMAASLVLPQARVARGATMLPRMRAAAKTGAVYGAAAGAGNGTGRQRVRNAVEGGAAGMVLGAAAEPVIGAAVSTGRNLVNAAAPYVLPTLGRARARIMGERDLGRALDLGGLTPADAAAAVRERGELGVPAFVGDLTPETRALTARAGRGAGPGQTAVREALEARQADMAQRTRGHLEASLGPVVDPHRQSAALIERAREAARPLYEEAYQTPVTVTPRLREFLDSPLGTPAIDAGANAIRQTPSAARNLGSEAPFKQGHVWDPQINAYRSAEAPVLETWDGAKRYLDDIEFAQGSQFQANPTGMTSDVRPVDLSRRAMIEELDAQVPAFAQARQAYAGPAKEREAFQFGLEDLPGSTRRTANDARAQMETMTPTQLEQFRLGDRTRLADQTHGHQGSPGRWADATTPINGNDARIDLVRAIHGDEAAEGLLARVTAEREAHLNYREAVRSPSAHLGEDDLAAASAALQAGRTLASGRPFAAVGGFIADAGRGRFGRHGAQVREEVGQMLTTADADAVDRTMRGVQHRLDRDALSAQRLQRGAHTASRIGTVGLVGHDGDYSGMEDIPDDYGDPYPY